MLITRSLLSELSTAAGQSPRLRKNRNFHAVDSAPAHRLLNALEPESYVRPHRHLDSAKDETMIVVRGKFGLVIFNHDGSVDSATAIEPAGEVIGVDIPHGTFHMILGLAPGSIFFEAKAGPYVPLAEAELASWAPAEGSTGAGPYLDRMRMLF